MPWRFVGADTHTEEQPRQSPNSAADLRPKPLPKVEEKTRLVIVTREDLRVNGLVEGKIYRKPSIFQ